MDIKNGKQWNGRYEIERILDSGGFGMVYLVRDKNTDCVMAMKESSSLKEVEYLKLFQNVAGVVPVWDYYQENGKYYYTMPYLSGGTLREYRKNNRICEEDILTMLYPICCGLKEIHRAGVIHRDISPDNLMFDHKGKLWLIDFGAARNIADDEIEECVPVRHGYAPPEQYTLEEDQDISGDIYALCAVIYFMITGADPISARQRKEGKQLLSLGVLGMCSERVSDAVMQGMSLNQTDRFQNIEELMEAFEKKKQFC